MTYRCATCDIAWWPYQTNNGQCRKCGGGTTRTNDPVSPEADAQYVLAVAAATLRAEKDRLHREFEAYYAQREARLNGLDALPVTDEPGIAA